MKHRLPQPKSVKAKLEGQTEPEQPELPTETPTGKDASSPRETPPPLPQPSVNNFSENSTLNEADSSNSFILGPDNPQAYVPKVPEPLIPEPTPVQNPVPVPVEQKPETSTNDDKPKTRRITPPPLPAPVKAISKKGPPPLPVTTQQTNPPPLLVPALVAEPVTTPFATTSVISSPVSRPEIQPVGEHAPFLIQTRGLVKQYGGRRVVNGVDIHVKAGEVVGLLGKNGAGKTTTFYMIVGLVAPTEGHVFMGDEDVTRMPMYRRARRGIGYLPQEESIFRKLTVEENLLAILETLPLTEEERDARCDELLRDFGLEHVRENVAITLSGGEKRRVTIARALVTSPTLLLLDEPFSGVDPMAVHDIQEIILQLKNRGLGVLITDHNVRETLSVVDRAYIIDEGRVLSEGSREFLINDPIAREIYLGHRFSM